MITFFVISGIPGSGKTTLAYKLAEQNNAALHSYDALPGANTKSSMDGSVKRIWLQAIHDDLQSGKSVVCDKLNLTVNDRKEILSVIEDIQCEKILYVTEVPLDVCLQRNRERQARLPDFVIEQAAQKFEAPTIDEGWDDIIISKM